MASCGLKGGIRETIMNLKKTKQIMAKEKEAELLRYKATEEYLTEKINEGEKNRQGILSELQQTIEELEKQIKFFGRK